MIHCGFFQTSLVLIILPAASVVLPPTSLVENPQLPPLKYLSFAIPLSRPLPFPSMISFYFPQLLQIIYLSLKISAKNHN